jgi:hypothetical protein
MSYLKPEVEEKSQTQVPLPQATDGWQLPFNIITIKHDNNTGCGTKGSNIKRQIITKIYKK